MRRPTFNSWDPVLLWGTGLSLLSLPVWAATPSLWPVLVGGSLATTLALVVLRGREPLTTRQVLWGAVVLRLAFLPLLPGLTDDLYRYIWDGLLQGEGINPYRYAPNHEALAEYQSAVIYDRLNSASYYSVYPPLSQLAFAVGGWAHDSGWTVSYYVLKGMFVGAELGGVWVLSRLTSARTLLLYAWNPLVLIETAGQGHVETLLVPCLLGLVWAVRHGRGRLASVAVAAAGLVKLYPFVLWPFLLRRYGWTAVWPGGLLAIAVSLPYAAPYTLPHIKASVDLFAHLFEFNAGPYYFFKHVAWLATGTDWSKVVGPTFRYVFLALLPGLYLLDARRDWSMRRAAFLTVGLFLVLSSTVHPWYIVPLLALGVVGPHPPWAWLWIGAFSIGTYLFYIGGSYWTWIALGWGGGAIIGGWAYASVIRQWGTAWARRARCFHYSDAIDS